MHANVSLKIIALAAVWSGLVWLNCNLSAQEVESQESFSKDQLEFFERQVRPLLDEHCYSCHSNQSKQLRGGLYLDNRQGMLQGGDSGSAIIPGDSASSLFMSAVRYDEYEMPPSGKLPDNEIEVFATWIDMGAPCPKEAKRDQKRETFSVEQRAMEHWSWQPIKRPGIPTNVPSNRVSSDIDRFILEKHQLNHVAAVDSADRYALLRRIYLDLIGLPPTTEQIEQFESDNSDHAFESVVDELLQSPHFGERWGRHWLDLVRYAESRGHEFDNDVPNAFQYRDYVIRALNADVPYDEFIREHIAGDLLDSPRLNPERGFNESILGTGFWFLGEWVHSPVDILKDESDRFDNMIDVMSKAFQGLTVSCARCHDHKFDAISTADYYSLTGFLQSSDYRQVRFESLTQNAGVARKLAELDQQFQNEIGERLRAEGVVLPSPTKVATDGNNTKRDLADHLVVVDYDNSTDVDFIQDGFIFGSGPRSAGEIYHTADGDIEIAEYGSVTNDPFWNGLESVTAGEMQEQNRLARIDSSGRMFRTPSFKLHSGNVDCLIAGKGHVIACVDSHRLIHGPLHGETIQRVQTNLSWTRLNLNRYVGHRIHLEFVPDKDQILSVRFVAQGATKQQLSDIELELDSKREIYRSYSDSVNQLLSTFSTASEIGKTDDHPIAQALGNWRRLREDLQRQVVRKSYLAPAMLDGSGEEANIYIRGDSSKIGAVVPRNYLSALCGEIPMELADGSGRMKLADAITASDNPLTTRVIVNRVWHYLMGRGIVSTTDDFGVLGTRPTHPELLDHLACRFVDDGQSIKKLIRYIVLSKTYQMSSVPDSESQRLDPANILWHYRPPKRIDGEAIRDSLLVLSGKFDSTQFGPPVPIHLTSFMEGRGRPKRSGPLDGNGRRSIYIAVRRNFLSPFLAAFDTPAPFSTMGRRTTSNVPAQALILMNDPFVFEQSTGWARLACEKQSGLNERIDWLYKSAFTRMPTESERQVALDFIGTNSDIERWISLAHALVNTKEFTFVR